MRICYLTGEEITEKDSPIKANHKTLEHIIPNALGGKLSSHYVITFSANQKLNQEIDRHFNKIFNPFILRLDIEKDRNNNPSLNALHSSYNKDVIFKNNKYFPKKPFYDKEKKTIYADSIKNGENYKKYLIKQGGIQNKENIKILDDMAGAINIPFGFENNLFKKGLAKISAGFATLKGIPRKNLNAIINLEEKNFRENIIASPFLPIIKPEGFFEENIHKSQYYPIHSIVLHGIKKEKFLYCYVELFSVFQWYILLDASYDGDNIYESYIYDILNSKEINYMEYINSIPSAPNLISKLPNYKTINLETFIALSHVTPTDLKFYNHRKFNTLSSFANYKFLTEKIRKLRLN